MSENEEENLHPAGTGGSTVNPGPTMLGEVESSGPTILGEVESSGTSGGGEMGE